MVTLAGILLWWKRMYEVIISLAITEIVEHPHPTPTFVPGSSLLGSSKSCVVDSPHGGEAALRSLTLPKVAT